MPTPRLLAVVPSPAPLPAVEPTSYVDVPEDVLDYSVKAGPDVITSLILLIVIGLAVLGCYSFVEGYLRKKMSKDGVSPAREDSKASLLEEGAPRSDSSPAKVRERVASDREEEEAIKARVSPQK